MSKQKGLETFWLNMAGEKAEVHINKHAVGHIDVQVTDVGEDLFKRMATAFGLKIRGHKGVRWFEFARARDGSRVTVFCGGESQ